jgi:zinc protease
MKKLSISLIALVSIGFSFGQTTKTNTSKKVEPLVIDRSKAPAAAPASPINIGEPVSFVLENGLKVFVVENSKLPKVSFQLSVDIPIFLEGNKVGLSTMAGEMMGAGTTTKTKAQIDEEIDFIGANLVTNSNGIFASCLSKHADKVLSVMGDVMLNPAFPTDELDKKKKRAQSNLKSISANADAIAGRVESVLLYGANHPYGEIQLSEHIDNITIEDCKQYYDKYFRPNISYLVIVGDIKPEKAKELANKYFGSWVKKDVPKQDFGKALPLNGVKVAFVNKPGAVQSVVKVIYPLDYMIGSDDAAAVSIMTGIFGGAFSSRLNMNLREKHAYTYGASGRVNADRYIGKFSAGASVRNDVTDSALTQIFYEMNQMINANVSEDELSRNKNFNMGNFALSLERSQTIAGFALNIEKFGLPKDYYQSYLTRIDKVTVEDVRNVAKKYIKPNNCIILIVGNEAVAEKLKRFASTGEIDFYDYNGKLKAKEVKAIPAGVTAQSVVTDYILTVTKSATMKDAQKKLKSLKDYSSTFEGEIQGQKLTMENKKMAPNLYKVEIKAMGMTMQKIVCDGKRVTSSGMQGNKEYKDKELEEMISNGSMIKETRYLTPSYEITLVGFAEVNGREVYQIQTKDKSGNVENEFYDCETKLKLSSSSMQESPEGPVEVSSEFSEYKEVGGILFPHKMSQNFGPMIIDFVAKQIVVNTKLKSSEFKVE